MTRDLAMLLVGWALGVLALGFLHGELQLGWAFTTALVGAIGLRKVLTRSTGVFPTFLALPLEAGFAAVGVLLAAWVTLVQYPVAYWVLRWRPAVAVALVTAVLGVGLATVIYTHRRLAAEISARELRLAQTQQAALEAQLRALQAQINPHFLFNALNTLAEVVHEDADLAEDLVADLAHMMRYALRSSMGQVPLGEELEVVDRYLRLERARLGERLSVEVEVEPEARALSVPGLILQPLVENAVQHAVAARREGGSVFVQVVRAGAGVAIRVEDDGPGIPAEVIAALSGAPTERPLGTGGAGGGLSSVHRRLSLAYADAPGLQVTERPGGGTRIELLLPVEPAPPAAVEEA